jgi:hypothetical protein
MRLGNDQFGLERIELLENFSRSVERVRGGGDCTEHRSVKATMMRGMQRKRRTRRPLKATMMQLWRGNLN